MQVEDVANRINNAIPKAQVDVLGEGCNFTVTVISAAFAGVRPVARQQQVLAAFVDVLQSGELHALSIRAWTPDEWRTQQTPVTLG